MEARGHQQSLCGGGWGQSMLWKGDWGQLWGMNRREKMETQPGERRCESPEVGDGSREEGEGRSLGLGSLRNRP